MAINIINLIRILDVFELHRARLKSLDRRIFLNESCPVDDFFGEDSSSVILVSMRRDSLHLVAGSYSLTVTCKKIRISCGDLSGLYYALNTLSQMFSLFKEEGLIPVVITDQPQFADALCHPLRGAHFCSRHCAPLGPDAAGVRHGYARRSGPVAR